MLKPMPRAGDLWVRMHDGIGLATCVVLSVRTDEHDDHDSVVTYVQLGPHADEGPHRGTYSARLWRHLPIDLVARTQGGRNRGT